MIARLNFRRRHRSVVVNIAMACITIIMMLVILFMQGNEVASLRNDYKKLNDKVLTQYNMKQGNAASNKAGVNDWDFFAQSTDGIKSNVYTIVGIIFSSKGPQDSKALIQDLSGQVEQYGVGAVLSDGTTVEEIGDNTVTLVHDNDRETLPLTWIFPGPQLNAGSQ